MQFDGPSSHRVHIMHSQQRTFCRWCKGNVFYRDGGETMTTEQRGGGGNVCERKPQSPDIECRLVGCS